MDSVLKTTHLKMKKGTLIDNVIGVHVSEHAQWSKAKVGVE